MTKINQNWPKLKLTNNSLLLQKNNVFRSCSIRNDCCCQIFGHVQFLMFVIIIIFWSYSNLISVIFIWSSELASKFFFNFVRIKYLIKLTLKTWLDLLVQISLEFCEYPGLHNFILFYPNWKAAARTTSA